MSSERAISFAVAVHFTLILAPCIKPAMFVMVEARLCNTSTKQHG